MTGVQEAAERFGFALPDVGLLLHGTTIATNAVLERRLARGVLLTTAGFEDVLEINRHVRRDIYGPAPEPFPTLISSARKNRQTTEIATTTPRSPNSAASTASVRSGFCRMRASSHSR
jgi:N-methylhydantoinase A/oxoprolinase/acetone carboxylase beta subunit